MTPDISKAKHHGEEASYRSPLETSAERSEANQTAALAKRSRVTLRATGHFEVELC